MMKKEIVNCWISVKREELEFRWLVCLQSMLGPVPSPLDNCSEMDGTLYRWLRILVLTLPLLVRPLFTLGLHCLLLKFQGLVLDKIIYPRLLTLPLCHRVWSHNPSSDEKMITPHLPSFPRDKMVALLLPCFTESQALLKASDIMRWARHMKSTTHHQMRREPLVKVWGIAYIRIYYVYGCKIHNVTELTQDY